MDVLELCAAAPDDDGPRLVWADQVGGERGELVVLQIDLARGGLPPEEIAIRRRRERELLAKHALEWAGSLASMAWRWSFRRGFVEAAKLDLTRFDAAKLADHPLLDSITVVPEQIELLDPVVEVVKPHGLAIQDGWVQDAHFQALALRPWVRVLRSLAVERAGDDKPALLDLVAKAPLEQLRVEGALDARFVTRLLAAAPGVVALELRDDNPRPVAVRPALARPLRALRATRIDDELAGPFADTIECLRFDAPGAQRVEHFDAMRSLHTLDIGGNGRELAMTLTATRHLEALRILRIRGALSTPLLHALVDRFGAQLELLELPSAQVRIAGEVRAPDQSVGSDRDTELLHASPAALLRLGRACLVRSQPAILVRLDPPGLIWDVPSMPAEDRFMIGRSAHCEIRIDSGMISRHHTALHWRDGRHEAHDCGTANGTFVNGVMVDRSPLADGDAITFGDVRARYFVGPGARDRAAAAIR